MANDRTAPGGMGMLLLALLEGRDMDGYEMIEALRARSNEVFRLKAGTLYPLLHTLEAQGWVTSSDGTVNGRTRRTYSITREGREAPAPRWSREVLAGRDSNLACRNNRCGRPYARPLSLQYMAGRREGDKKGGERFPLPSSRLAYSMFSPKVPWLWAVR